MRHVIYSFSRWYESLTQLVQKRARDSMISQESTDSFDLTSSEDTVSRDSFDLEHCVNAEATGSVDVPETTKSDTNALH